MSQTSIPATPQNGKVRMEVGQEVRFAVVMYGGVSLAIYINGVAQELLHLVRATAPDPDDPAKPYQDSVDGTEKVYRRLGQMLDGTGTAAQKAWAGSDPIRTRFVIDVLSGTSAGGINGIYLAKALANGQSIAKLQELWVEKGDVAVLLNDGKNLPPPLRQEPPQSLLSGRYMYAELLSAFKGMDETKALPRSPFVDDLDLFVTTTDIRGLPIPLRLWDKVADEKRHRNVFRFRYSGGQTEEPRNDFQADNNPLLAFAARCTSAFPFAFEPMRAEDAVAVKPGQPHAWDEFFPMYRVPPGVPEEAAPAFRWSERAFGDGGYLDNKPFTYAIEMLGARRAAVPVDRKLLYIEPDPEQIDWRQAANDRERPNAIENVNAALSLARYETIREDLERILERNILIERVDRILSGMERDVSVEAQHKAQFAQPAYRGIGLRDSILWYGAGYGGYHRLKIAVLTDELTEMVARIAGFDPDSDQFKAIRYLVRAWRDRHYAENGEGGLLTQNEFLFEFDLAYRLRRLNFVLRKIDELFCLNDRSRTLLERWQVTMPNTPEERTAFRSELRRLCKGLGKAQEILRGARTTIRRAADVGSAIASTGLTVDSLRAILDAATEEEREAKARSLFDDSQLANAFDALRQAVGGHIRTAAQSAASECEALLDGAGAGAGEGPFETQGRIIVRAYYTSFESYDLIAYPILYSTGVGDEMDPVEVLRISPQDAPLVKKPGERKLAGTSLAHFGAFLDRGWRENDILWGRLDGAERLITVLLQGAGYPEQLGRDLVAEAHLAILEETFGRANRDQLCQLLADAITKGAAGGAAPEALRDLVATKTGTTLNPKIEAALRACLEPGQLYEFFKTGYQVNLDLDRRATTDTLGRATRITGRLLEDIAKRERVTDRPAVWLARVGTGISALVELAVPSGIRGAVGRRVFALLVLFGVVLFAGGLALAEENVERFGIVVLIFTLGGLGLAYLLGDFVARRRGWRRLLSAGAAVTAAGVLLLALLGALHFLEDAHRVGDRLGLCMSNQAQTTSTSP